MDSDEQALKRKLINDLKTHFDLLVLTYQQKLYTLALHIVRNRQDAEEIVQDAFVNAYRALTNFSDLETQTLKFRPWLIKITYNLCLNHINRRRNSQPQLVSIDQPQGRELLEEREQSQSISPEMEAEYREAYNELCSYIDQLPEILRSPLILHYIAGLQYREIAEITHQLPNTVKSNGRRGLKKLHEIITKQKEG